MRMARHTCKYFTPAHRGQRRCKYCNRQKFQVAKGEWRWVDDIGPSSRTSGSQP